MRRDYIDTPRGQIHVRAIGTGPELVLLLHQTASSSAMFEGFAEAVMDTVGSERLRLVAVDTPGFGASYRPDVPYTLEWWAEDMAAIVDALGPGPCHVLGHHTGAAIGIVLAATRPDRVRSLSMVGAVAISEQERRRWLTTVHPMRLAADGAHLGVAWHQVGHIDGEPTRPPSLELQHRECVDKLAAGPRWHEAYLAVFGTDLEQYLRATQLPVQLICGTADVLYPYVGVTVAARPDLHRIDLDAGGYALDQCPRRVAKAYLDFLARTAEAA